jgi:two-component system nitrate/nitrite response regulator NarL
MSRVPALPLRVVVIDDHPSFRRAARELLAWRGHAVVGEAGCAATAVPLVAALRPDAVVLDVRLGEDSGLRLAGDLRRRHPGLGIVLVSTDAEAAVRACAGVHGPLPKERLAEIDLAALLV